MVLGGVDVSVLPGEAGAHASTIVIGRGETAWPRRLRTFGRSEKGVYREQALAGSALVDAPLPRRDFSAAAAT